MCLTNIQYEVSPIYNPTKFKRKKVIFYFLLFFSILSNMYAQNIHSNFQLRNSHLWRGIEVSTGIVGTGDLYLDWKNMYIGCWGGSNSEGTYKEFNHFIGYKTSGLTVELWDIYNFSPNATYNNKQYFNYSAGQTGRFWDFRSSYKISEKVPLILSWNSVVFGRDRNEENTQNKYSYFTSAEYLVYRKDSLEISLRVGYSDALINTNEKGNFFAHNKGFNEVSLIVTKQIPFINYKIPVGIWAMWNPVDNNAFLQFSAQVYSF